MKENNKIFRECYENHFIKKFKPEQTGPKSTSVESQELMSLKEGNLENVKYVKLNGSGLRFKKTSETGHAEFSLSTTYLTCSYT